MMKITSCFAVSVLQLFASYGLSHYNICCNFAVATDSICAVWFITMCRMACVRPNVSAADCIVMQANYHIRARFLQLMRIDMHDEY